MSKIPFTSYGLKGSRGDCPLCQSGKAEPLSRWDRRLKRLPHVKCTECGLIRQEFLPSAEALAAYYRQDYRRDYQNVAQGPTDRHIAKRKAEAEARLVRLRPHLPANGGVIDFGCGSGEFVEACASAGFCAQGFEPGEPYAIHARDRRGLRVENCGWQDFTAPEGGVAAVTSFHVFEHLTDPMAAFRRAASWLAPGGVVYIEVPNMANALNKGFGCLHLAHVLGFGRHSVELMGAMAGMAVVEVFDDYDVGMIFRHGTPRDLDAIKQDARAELQQWTQSRVHRQFWSYTLGKLTGRRRRAIGAVTSA